MLKQIVALRVEQWREDPAVSAAYLTWMYEKNPFADKTLIYVALAEGKVVGMRGMSSGILASGDELYPIAAATDTIVAPAHRGRRLFNSLTRFALEDIAKQGYDYALNLAGARTTRLLSLRSGWIRVCAYHPLYWGAVPGETNQRDSLFRRALRRSWFYPGMRTLRPYVKRYQRQISSAGRPAFQKFDAWASEASMPKGIVVAQEPRPQQMADLVRRHSANDPRIRLHLDEKYYAWRFKDPRSTFRFVFAEGGDAGLAGFLVLLQMRSGEIAIVDWQCSDEQVWLEMLRTVLESGSVSSLSVWSTTLRPPLLEVLESLGFRAGPEVDTRTDPARGLFLTATRPGTSAEAWTLQGRVLSQPAQWDLRMIFSDAY